MESTNCWQQLFFNLGVLVLTTDFHWKNRFSMELKNGLHAGWYKSCVRWHTFDLQAVVKFALSITNETFSIKNLSLSPYNIWILQKIWRVIEWNLKIIKLNCKPRITTYTTVHIYWNDMFFVSILKTVIAIMMIL